MPPAPNNTVRWPHFGPAGPKSLYGHTRQHVRAQPHGYPVAQRPSMLHVISRTLELSKSQQHTMPNMHVQQHEVRVGTYRTLPWNARVVVAALGGRAGTSFKAASASISSRETRTASSVLPKDMLKLVDSLEGQTGPQVCWPKGQEDWSLPASLNRALFTNETSYQDPGVSRCAR